MVSIKDRKILRQMFSHYDYVMTTAQLSKEKLYYGEILEQWRVITKEKRVDIVVLDMPLLDTRARGQDLTGTFIADLVLQILSYVAQTEREMIRKRQAEGIAAAKARGVKFGRRPLPLPESYEDVRQKWESGQLSARAAAIALGVSHSTFLKWTRYK